MIIRVCYFDDIYCYTREQFADLATKLDLNHHGNKLV